MPSDSAMARRVTSAGRQIHARLASGPDREKTTAMSALADVRIYLTTWCPYCVAAKRLLDQKGVAFTEVDVDDRRELRSWLVSASGQRTVPQIFINGQSVGGFSDLSALDQHGELDALLAQGPSAGAATLPA